MGFTSCNMKKPVCSSGYSWPTSAPKLLYKRVNKKVYIGKRAGQIDGPKDRCGGADKQTIL